jgi:salicylate hydroxylase
LGTDNPRAHPENTGWWNLFSIKPYREAQQLLDINDTWQRGWVGDGVASMYSIFDRGQAVVMLLACRDQNPGEAYARPVSANEIRQICHDWPPCLLKATETVRTPGSLQNKLLLQHRMVAHEMHANYQFFCEKSEQTALYLWEHAIPAPSYCAGPVCLLGDAAHTTTPW